MAAAPCWRCRLDRFFFWLNVAINYALVAVAGFIAGGFWMLGQVPL